MSPSSWENGAHGMNLRDEQKRYPALSGYPDFHARVEAAERYAVKILPFIPRGLPVYQSHGTGHSLAIIGNLNRLIGSPELPVHHAEAFILYLAAWFHDIGYLNPLSIHNRSMHPALSVEMIRRDPIIQGLVRKEELSTLEIIVRYHDSHVDLTRIQEIKPGIRTPLLAALFRFVDALDIGTDRCPPEVFILIEEGLDEHSKRHWQAHQNILRVTTTYPVIRILVHDPDNPFFRRRIVPHLEEDRLSVNQILEQYGFVPFTVIYQRSDPDSHQIIPS